MFDPENRLPPQQDAARSHEQRLRSRKTAARRTEQSLPEVVNKAALVKPSQIRALAARNNISPTTERAAARWRDGLQPI
ncbi:hypothetical protein [Streptomyces sp. NBC_01443]|uniref:hypothetical protein n=1 Tax=Streptomyces sp. NBC_01443 TaxID=2903868 RepID=UPI0022596F4A|nr:hypothetical protein [Streptomyces sp. NBC_01443]MCX4632276.1 hypothetical protein [Streptomyces sp. NBC_01443]